MENYGLIMKGPFVCEKVATLPEWTANDEGRFIYTIDEEKTYFGSSSEWLKFGTGELEEVATLPEWTEDYIGKFLYAQDADKVYFGSVDNFISLENSFPNIETTEGKDTGYNITVDDSFKTFTCNSASTQTFNLPSVSSANIGIEYTISKLGTGTVIIDAADSDLIEDSGAGDTIYCEDETIATITLKLVTATQWVIKGVATGTWITTD